MQASNKVIFINPPSRLNRKLIRNFDCATESKANYLYQPYDKLLLSSHFESNEFALIDAIADSIQIDQVITIINNLSNSFNIEYFIVSLADTNWLEDFDFLKTLNSLYPQTPIFIFGDSFIEDLARKEVSNLCSGILSNPLEINRADLEGHIKERGKTWYHGPGFINANTYSRSNLKKPTKVKIGLPKHEKFLSQSYRWPFAKHFKYTTVFTAWGCPYSCSYCVVSKFPNLYREANEVIEEMRQIKNLNIKEVYIGDRSFGLPRENVIKLLRGMIDEKFHFSWSTYFHPNQYDPELLELMKESGCHTLIIGIESKNFKSLKKYGRHMKEEKFFNLLEHAKKLNIDICGDFMIGLPYEKREDILKTISFAKSLNLDFASFNIAAPLAGSSIRKSAIERGDVARDQVKHFDSFGFHKALGNGILSGEEIIKLRNKAVLNFYLSPRYLFRRLLKTSSLTHLTIQFQEMLQILKKSIVKLKT